MTALDNVANGLLYAGPPARATARGGARRVGTRRPRPPPHPPPAAAVGRRAPAGRDRAGARQAAADRPRRRADRQPRLAVGRRGRARCCRSPASEGATLVLITHDPADRRRVPPADRCATARSSETSGAELDAELTPSSPPPAGRCDPTRSPARRAASCWGGVAGAAHPPPAGGAVGARDRDRDRRDGRGRRGLGVQPGQPARRDRRARHQPADGHARLRRSSGTNEVLPETSVPMIDHMRARAARAAVYQVSSAVGAAHAVRAAPSRPAGSASTPPTAGCRRCWARARGRPVHQRDQRAATRGRARRAGRQRRCRSARRRHIQVYLGDTWFIVVGDHEAGRPRPDPRLASCSSGCRSPSGCSAQPNASEIYVRANVRPGHPGRELLAPTADPQNADGVQVSRPSDALEARAAAKGQFTTLLLGLGAVALLVGAIGIANIMVISVLERRGEIGLRRALGATQRHISAQFLAESALLAALGGVAGLLLGAARRGLCAGPAPAVRRAAGRAHRRPRRRTGDRHGRRAVPRGQSGEAEPDRGAAHLTGASARATWRGARAAAARRARGCDRRSRSASARRTRHRRASPASPPDG